MPEHTFDPHTVGELVPTCPACDAAGRRWLYARIMAADDDTGQVLVGIPEDHSSVLVVSYSRSPIKRANTQPVRTRPITAAQPDGEVVL